MKVYRVYVVEGQGYDGTIWEDVGVFLSSDDANKCVDLCEQMIEDGRLQFDYACVDTYEIEGLEAVMKRLEEEMCVKSEDEQ